MATVDARVLLIFVALLVVVASWWLVGRVRDYTLRWGQLDVPNERSSHSVPTPRGGGLVQVVILTVAGAVLSCSGLISPVIGTALSAGLFVALVGWIDDRGHVHPLLRAVVHLVCSAWAVYWLGGVFEINVGLTTLKLGWAGSLFATLALVWLINLYNFMDGSDGLAACEAITVGATTALLLWYKGQIGLAWFCLILALTNSGFLIWNWPPAKIFMGDVGSGSLGFIFGVIALVAERQSVMPALVSTMLLSLFIADATYTLFRRLMQGERWYAAHRQHAYQRLIACGWLHRDVLWLLVSINALVCLPLVFVGLDYPRHLLWLNIGLYLALWCFWSMVQKMARRSECINSSTAMND